MSTPQDTTQPEASGAGEVLESAGLGQDEADEDVAGHGRYALGVEDANDDVEGHRRRFGGGIEDTDDDVEGHRRATN
jgi:hypothetical protein